MAKVEELSGSDVFSHHFYCEGCKTHHGFNATLDREPRWTWNNDRERPTIQPSILITYPVHKGQNRICHSFVTNGKIQYLNDSTHDLAGQTVELTEV